MSKSDINQQPFTNRLLHETSPYLMQHAHNPVDWYPWGPEALERAHTENKPILLSVGYSACHWCHVMAHELFEDPATAELMNQNFVNIKVDREERPDLDGIYMEAVQAMTGRGGWPMTVFLTPDGVPFYAGTYFPPDDRYAPQMPSFPAILLALAEAWEQRPADIAHNATQIKKILENNLKLANQSSDTLNEDLLKTAWATLAGQFDFKRGGLNGAPKFPQPMLLDFATALLPAFPRPACATSNRTDPAQNGEWWNVRPVGWWLSSLFDGCGLARAALRENALRQRPTFANLPECLLANWQRFL